MSETEKRLVPKEGSNHIDHDDGQLRSNISPVISSPHPKLEEKEGVDPLPEDVEPTQGDNELPQPDHSDRPVQE